MSQQTHCALRILQRQLDLWCFFDIVSAMMPRLRNAVFQNDAGYTLFRDPVADFSSFKIHCDGGVSTTWKDEHRSPSISSPGLVDRHRWARDITRPVPRPPRNQPGTVANFFGFVVGFRFLYHETIGPYRQLLSLGPRLPNHRFRNLLYLAFCGGKADAECQQQS